MDGNNNIPENQENNINIQQNNNNNSYFFCSDRAKLWLKIIFCPFYCLFYKSIKCFWDERWYEPYYESILFKENILFCILSIFDTIPLALKFKELSLCFFIIRIISNFICVLVFWLTIVCWDEEASDEDHFDPGCCCFTLMTTVITIILDISSIFIYFFTDSEFNILILISLSIHFLVILILFIIDLIYLKK